MCVWGLMASTTPHSRETRERQREAKGKERAEIKRKADRHTHRERGELVESFLFFPSFSNYTLKPFGTKRGLLYASQSELCGLFFFSYIRQPTGCQQMAGKRGDKIREKSIL